LHCSREHSPDRLCDIIQAHAESHFMRHVPLTKMGQLNWFSIADPVE
jgi:hypothetical protein